jgi:L-threonylcarbamoyladenylate synthase
MPAMKTLLLKVDPINPDPIKIQTAADILKQGGLVAFPTETVYGLGADALNTKAILSLFEAKKRPLDNPAIIHIANIDDVHPLVSEVSEKAQILMQKFWPGPLTLLFKRSEKVPAVSVAGLDTIAVRMPQHKVALSLIRKACRPIAAPSANLAGKPSPTTASHVYIDLNGRIDAILDAGPTHIGVESTVIDLSQDPPMLLRPGGTSFEALKNVISDLRLHPFVEAEKELPSEKVRSPGMRHKHYAPNATVILVEGNVNSVVIKIIELAETLRTKGNCVGILATEETKTRYQNAVIKSLGSRFNLPSIAKNLFGSLREVDVEGVDIVLVESVPSEGLGLAIMNRLRKASGYNIVKV